MEVIEHPHGTEPASEIEREVEELIGKWAGNPSKTIMAMLAVQEKYNWLPQEALEYISIRLGVPKGQIYHIATFYKVFSLLRRGKHILQLCTGTGCHILGSTLLAKSLEKQHGIPWNGTSDDGLFTLEPVNCIGACSMGPVIVVDGEYHGSVTHDRINSVVKRLKKQANKEGNNGEA